jgi:hypothetical protein
MHFRWHATEAKSTVSPGVAGTFGGNEIFNVVENHEWIPGAPLLVVIQTHRNGCPNAANDSMAGFGLCKAATLEVS